MKDIVVRIQILPCTRIYFLYSPTIEKYFTVFCLHVKNILPALIFLAVLPYCSLLSQNVGYKLYTVADGLVQSEVTCIHQDRKGLLWIGTKLGISRFDGKTFQTITDSSQVSQSQISEIHSLNDSAVLIMSYKGLVVYTYGRYRDRVSSIKRPWYPNLVHRQNEKFIVINDFGGKIELLEVGSHGIRVINPPWFELFRKHFSPNADLCKNFSGADGNIYFKDDHSDLYCIKGQRIIKMKRQSEINTLTGGRDGNLYAIGLGNYMNLAKMGTGLIPVKDLNFEEPGSASLYRISDTAMTLVHNLGQIPKSWLMQWTVFDSATQLGVASDHFTLYRNGQKTVYPIDVNLGWGNCIDREGNLWLGSPQGLIRILPDCFTYYGEKDGLKNNQQCVIRDRNGDLIMGNYDHSIQLLKNGKLVNLQIPQVLKGQPAISVYPGGGVDHDGIVHLTVNCVLQITWDGNRLSFSKNNPFIGSFFFFEDPRDYTDYIGSYIGLVIQQENKPYSVKTIFPGNKTNRIVSIVLDGKNRMLLGGFQGLTIMEGERIRHLPDKEFNYEKGANAMAKDTRGNIWIGNSDGLYHFDNQKFKKVRNPWFNDLVVSLCMIDSTRMFIGGLRGIGILDLKKYYRDDTAVIRYFNRDNGFFGNECQQNGVTLDKDGKIWFVTTNSLVRLDPEKIPVSSGSPLVYISRVSITDLKMHEEPVVSTLVSSGKLDLGHDQVNLKIDFLGLCFRGPSFVRYRYMLKGYDLNWTAPSGSAFAAYTNLDPGKYTFRVTACNDEGRWSEKPAEIEIVIHPAFWQTWWFFLLFSLVFITLVSGATLIVTRRMRRKKQRELLYQKTVAELQFKTLKNQLAPHFIFNALNSIGSSIYQSDTRGAYDMLVKFSRLIRLTLTNADRTSRSLAEEVEFVRFYLEIEKSRFADRFTFQIMVDPSVSPEMHVPRNIIQTFAENSVKHGLLHKEGTGTILIRASNISNGLEFIIEDDGIGRVAAEKFRGNSTGKGMDIINGFIRLFNTFNESKIELEITDLHDEKHESAGTRVRVVVPFIYTYSLIHENKKE